MLVTKFMESPLASAGPMREFPARPFDKYLLSENQYERLINQRGFKGYGGYGQVMRMLPVAWQYKPRRNRIIIY